MRHNINDRSQIGIQCTSMLAILTPQQYENNDNYIMEICKASVVWCSDQANPAPTAITITPWIWLQNLWLSKRVEF